jgi:hypothetical protein
MPRLTIELVPSTSWFSNVRSEVPAAVWDKLKKTAYKLAHYRCEICSGRGRQWPVECHEVWHYNDASHIQKLVRLIALCPMCHRVKHIGLASVNEGFEEVVQHLMKVNQWADRITANSYINLSLQKWQDRSRFEWQLDLSYLEQFGITKEMLAKSRAAKDTMKIMMDQALRLPSGVQLVDLPDDDYDPLDHLIEERIA